MIDRERFPWQRVLCQNATRSVRKVPIGEPSLSSVEECLSLHGSLLTEGEKTGNVSPTQAPDKERPLLPMPGRAGDSWAVS
jgi:hypothetical protein